MKIGVTLPSMIPGASGDLVLEWARRADAGPFSTLATGERILYPSHDIMVALAAAAAVTRRVRLLCNIVVLPLHSAAIIAKQVASLDLLSGGRVVLGVGIGGRQDDFDAVGASFDKRHRRMEQQVAALRRMWSGKPPLAGGSPVGPQPIQEGGPEILVGAVFPDAVKRVARWADGLSTWSFEPNAEVVSSTYDLAREAWRAAGRVNPPRLVAGCYFALGDGAAERMHEYLHHYHAYFGSDLATQMASSVKTTSPQAIVEALRAFADMGTDEMILVPTVARIEQLDRLTDVVASWRP